MGNSKKRGGDYIDPHEYPAVQLEVDHEDDIETAAIDAFFNRFAEEGITYPAIAIEAQIEGQTRLFELTLTPKLQERGRFKNFRDLWDNGPTGWKKSFCERTGISYLTIKRLAEGEYVTPKTRDLILNECPFAFDE